MNPSPFRLLPWEHGGVSPAPSHFFEARVEDKSQRFEAKWREGRAFFRLANADDDRVWASWHNVGASHIVGAIESGAVGRYFAVERSFSTRTVSAEFAARVQWNTGSYELFGPTTLAVIVNDEYRGRAQEWCGGPWLEFALPERAPIGSGARKPSIWHRGWNVVGLRGALASLAGEFGFRAFEPDETKNRELYFASGCAQQLQRLCQAAFLACAQREIERSPWLRGYARGKHTQHIQAESAQGRAKPFSNYFVPAPLLAAFVRHNLPVGGDWRCVQPQREAMAQTNRKLNRFLTRNSAPPEPVLARVDYHFSAPLVSFEIEMTLEASAHQQLEARLFVRDWMRENLSPAEFEKLKEYLEARL